MLMNTYGECCSDVRGKAFDATEHFLQAVKQQFAKVIDTFNILVIMSVWDPNCCEWTKWNFYRFQSLSK